ncbi:hypothetical protein Trydic_g14285 [Trypoxylus dichotomus]
MLVKEVLTVPFVKLKHYKNESNVKGVCIDKIFLDEIVQDMPISKQKEPRTIDIDANRKSTPEFIQIWKKVDSNTSIYVRNTSKPQISRLALTSIKKLYINHIKSIVTMEML